MSQLLRRKPIADVMANEGSDQSLRRVLGAGDLVMLAPLGAIACGFIMVGLPPQAWERFGLWLIVGPPRVPRC